ncbi:MAG: hypothetical protein OFPI_40930 [Osedax symbiont Rs2]|nr:MAG: hypothetical protein OFPI_40930 [Osedax symbiont Rs2]
MPSSSNVNTVVEKLQKLRYFNGEANQFWSEYIDLIRALLNAEYALLSVYEDTEQRWKNLLLSPQNTPQTVGEEQMATLQGMASIDAAPAYSFTNDVANNRSLFCAYLKLDESNPVSAISFILPGKEHTPELPATLLFKLVSDIPNDYLRHLKFRQSGINNDAAYEVLELMTTLQSSHKYSETALSLCNEIATRHQFSRVSLGWVEQGYVSIKAISHVNKFKKKMQLPRQLELAMEEAADQEQEISWPNDSNEVVYRNHAELARLVQCKNIHTLPLRYNNEVVGVLCIESNRVNYVDELLRLRICCDQVTEKLVYQKQKDAWFGRRFLNYCRDKFSKLLGVEHTLTKALGILVSMMLITLAVIQIEYRIEAPFIVRATNLHYITSPYDAYIEESYARAGDLVGEKKLLISLNTDALQLQKSSILADLSRYNSEYEKARASNSLADMNIAFSLRQQTKVRLSEIHYYLKQAQITSPIEGLVVEGDLSRLSGSSIKKGDLLLKVATLDQLYLELELDEQYIHEIKQRFTGESAFQSQPGLHFPFELTRINPAAEVKEGKNIFKLEGQFVDKREDWWRPGMSGLAKIAVGERSLIWVLTHKTTAFFRLWLWW